MDTTTSGRQPRIAPWAALALVPASIIIVALMQREPSLLPGAWGASGFLMGAVVGLRGRQRIVACGLGSVSTVIALMAIGTSVGLAVTLGAILALEVRIARAMLFYGARRFELSGRADVWRLIKTTAVAAGVSALLTGVYLLTVADQPAATTRLLVLGVFMSHAASILALLPFFVPSQRPVEPMRLVSFTAASSLLVGLTLLVFVVPGTPPVFFALLPAFAWLALRAPLPWAATVLVMFGALTIWFTLQGVGPINATVALFGLPSLLTMPLLNLFLLDCALVMYPVAVIVLQHARAAEAAHVDRARLAGVLDGASSVGIVATDRSDRIVLFSEGAVRLTGLAAEDMLGQPVTALGAPLQDAGSSADRPSSDLPDDLEDAHSASPRRLWTLPQADGSTRVLAVAVMATQTHEQRSTGRVITLEDLTHQRAAHQATKNALAREKELVAHLGELDHVKDAFVATVSHELRTPVTSIAGYLEMLTDGDAGEVSLEQRDLLQRVARNSRRLQVLVEDLLLLSRIESRSLKLQPERFDVVQTARDVVARSSAAIANPAQPLTLESSGPAWMHGDPAQIERMIGIFLDNAIKFSPDATPVTVRVHANEKFVELTVADTGVGIPVEEQQHLFTPFFRSTTALQMAAQGAGMGLAIGQAVCHAHGGSIQVDSVHGQGTSVSVLLPVAGASSLPETSDWSLPLPRGHENHVG